MKRSKSKRLKRQKRQKKHSSRPTVGNPFLRTLATGHPSQREVFNSPEAKILADAAFAVAVARPPSNPDAGAYLAALQSILPKTTYDLEGIFILTLGTLAIIQNAGRQSTLLEILEDMDRRLSPAEKSDYEAEIKTYVTWLYG